MLRTVPRPLAVPAVLVCAWLVGCGKDGPVEPKPATKIEVVAGAGQTGGAGSSLPIKVAVKASDAQGGAVAGTVISAATESQGGGSVSPTSATTGVNGQAEFTWTLGSKIGIQVLTFTATSLPAVTASATGQTGAASTIFPVSDIFQFAVVSHAVSILPAVTVADAFGNPVAGVSVVFDAPVAGSVLGGTTATTDATGLARIGSWTIGPDAISYSVRALIGSGPAAGQSTVFEARGVPATAIAVEGIAQTANAGTAVTAPPGVRAAREDGSPLAGVGVTFAVVSGGGSIQGAGAVTGSDGIARASGWILGATPGSNRVDAQVAGLPAVAFTATGIAGVPSAITASSPTGLTGFFGNYVSVPPSVVVKDAQGRPVAGSTVTFQLLGADGQIVGTSQASDFLGRATLGGWRLGSGTSAAVSATDGAAPPVTFTATAGAPPASTFKIEVRYRSPADGCPTCQVPTAAEQAAFDLAAARWKQIILSGSAPYPVNEPASSCFPAMNETVDGLLIFANLVPIDGVNNILGSAGPCIVRDDHGFQPAVGLMRFDTADLVALGNLGMLNDVILHEMGHVLGFGTMWNFDPRPGELIPIGPDNPINALLTGAGGPDPVFTGPSTRGAFLGAVAVGRTFTGVPVPVENMFGLGTRDSHWRESTVSTELMTGFISNPGVPNPLSAFTAASFRDLGYIVNDAVTDEFTFQASLQAVPQLIMPTFGSGFQLREAAMTDPIIVIDRRGRRVATVSRFFQ
ncbi:MAG TPA: leishmanolysin-related zinc metalloendopeptidase [Gemmatimonadales bacterium]|nr:leishmanolysin-related zinc metalloendopeptidase [Gemmatimonadales bacterium]